MPHWLDIGSPWLPAKLGTWLRARWGRDYLNIKILLYQCRNSHDKDKMVSRPSYLYHGNSCTWKMVFILKQDPWCQCVVLLLGATCCCSLAGSCACWPGGLRAICQAAEAGQYARLHTCPQHSRHPGLHNSPPPVTAGMVHNSSRTAAHPANKDQLSPVLASGQSMPAWGTAAHSMCTSSGWIETTGWSSGSSH